MLRLLWAPGPFPEHRADSTCSGMPLSACSCDVQTIHTCFRLFTFLLSSMGWASFLPFPGNCFFQFASFMLIVYQTHLQSEYPTDYVLWRARNFKSFCICRAEVTPMNPWELFIFLWEPFSSLIALQQRSLTQTLTRMGWGRDSTWYGPQPLVLETSEVILLPFSCVPFTSLMAPRLSQIESAEKLQVDEESRESEPFGIKEIHNKSWTWSKSPWLLWCLGIGSLTQNF